MDSIDIKSRVVGVVLIPVYVVVFGFFAFIFIRGIFRWLRNKMSLEETVAANFLGFRRMSK